MPGVDVNREFEKLLAQGAEYTSNVTGFIKQLISEIIERDKTIKKLVEDNTKLSKPTKTSKK